MPTYNFEAKNEAGQIVTGTLVAKDEASAKKIIQQNKWVLLSLAPQKETVKILPSRISVRDKAIFLKQLATMLLAGFPIMQALSVNMVQTKNPALKEVINDLIQNLEAGHSFSSALAKHPDIFPEIVVSAVKAGEASGKLPRILSEVAKTIEKDYEFRSKLRSAVVYPIFVIVVMIIIAILFVIKVVPQLEMLFAETGAKLPITTLIIISLSHIVINYWWAILLVLIVCGIAFYFWQKTESGKEQIDFIKLKLPLFGPVWLASQMAIFCRTFSLLTGAGVPILESIKLSRKIINNLIYQKEIDRIYAEVEKGVAMSVPFMRSEFFPPMVGQMMGVGEKTGKMEEVLKTLANFYEFDATEKIKHLTSLLEPAIIILIGLGVAYMVFSIIIPIYQLAQVI